MPYSVRNLREADIPVYVEFYNATTEPDHRINADKAMALTFRDATYDPARHFIAVDERSRIDADCRADMNRNFIEANGPISGITLHYRKRDAADRVMLAVVAYLAPLGIEKVTTWVRAKSPVWSYLEGRGFCILREFTVMHAEPKRCRENPPEGYIIRPAVFPEEKQLFKNLINTSFKGHFGWYEMDDADFERRYMLPEKMDRSGFYIALDPEGKPAGVVASYFKSSDTGDMRGLGVLPEHRGKGLGRLLAASSVGFFAEKWVKKVTLGVDSTNERALAIYSSLGFKEDYTVLVTEASINDVKSSIGGRLSGFTGSEGT